VLTENGETAIEEIRVGDLVYSENPVTGEEGYKEVTTVYVSEASALVHLRVNGVGIAATPSHPFWVEHQGWVEAADIKPGDELRLEEDGLTAVVELVEYETLAAPIPVYNLEVADWHTYYVSSESVFVHNMCNIPNIIISDKKLRHVFGKHVAVLELFGIKNSMSKDNLNKLKELILKHTETTTPIEGYYRGMPVYHFYDETTSLDVMVLLNGELEAVFILGPDQIKNLFGSSKNVT
jgi:hypothetical protein